MKHFSGLPEEATWTCVEAIFSRERPYLLVHDMMTETVQYNKAC
jgi:hypothetical protein